jgi:hypothetical protein
MKLPEGAAPGLGMFFQMLDTARNAINTFIMVASQENLLGCTHVAILEGVLHSVLPVLM